VVQVVEGLPRKQEALSSNPVQKKEERERGRRGKEGRKERREGGKGKKE
jgi:hypothetical protein